MNIIYPFIDSFNTYSFKNLPCLVQALVCGDLHIVVTILRRFRASHFSDKHIMLPNFYSSFSESLHFQGRPGSQEEAHITSAPRKQQVSLPNTKRGSTECFVIIYCSTFSFLLFLPSHGSSQPTHHTQGF